MKKLVNIALLVFISSCVPFSMLEIKDIPNEMPRKVIINQDDSGLVVYNDGIYRINNLEITKNKIPLNESKSDYGVGYVLFNEDEGFNNLIYSKVLDKYDSAGTFEDFNLESQFYIIKIPKKSNDINSPKELFKDRGIDIKRDNTKISKINNTKYFFLCTKEIQNDYRSIVLKVLNNGILENYELDSTKLLSNPRYYPIVNFDFSKVNIDDSGNGFFSYSKDYTAYFIYELKNYQKKEILYTEDFSKNKYLFEVLQNTLDPKGNGFITYHKNLTQNSHNIFLTKFQDFKKISEDKIISLANKKLLDIKINSDGNGYILLSSLNPKSINEVLETNIKKIVDFKVVEGDNKIIEANDDLKEYYDSSINEKGDGLIVFKSTDPDIKNKFKIVKIRNYELSK